MAPSHRGPKPPPEGDELQALFDAAVQVIARDGVEGATLAALLTQAGLGTRAFYRHFDSKDDFLVATWLRETQAAGALLDLKIARTRSPGRAVEVWIDDFLDRLYTPEGAPHVEALWRNGFWLRNAYPKDFSSIVRVQVNTLVHCLKAGLASGDFPDSDPLLDANTLLATCWMFAELSLRGDAVPRAVARRHLRRVVRGLTGSVVGGERAPSVRGNGHATGISLRANNSRDGRPADRYVQRGAK